MRATSYFAVIVASALGLAACGGEDDDDDGAGGSGATSGSSTEGGSAGTTGGTSGGSAPTSGNGGTDTGGTGGTAPEPPPASAFSCDDLEPEADDVTARSCFDFTDGSATGWVADGGDFAVTDGGYYATGPAEAVTCPTTGSFITASVLEAVSAADVRVHAELTSLERPDKVVVLRSRDSGNRIELNFRASFVDEELGTPDGGDLVIQELVDCQQVMHVTVGTVPVPHEQREPIDVDIELRGQALTVWVGGEVVFDEEVPVSTEPGAVGVGVITASMTRFDDLVIETLE